MSACPPSRLLLAAELVDERTVLVEDDLQVVEAAGGSPVRHSDPRDDEVAIGRRAERRRRVDDFASRRDTRRRPRAARVRRARVEVGAIDLHGPTDVVVAVRQRVRAGRPDVLRAGAAVRLIELQAPVRHDLDLRVGRRAVGEREADVDRRGNRVIRARRRGPGALGRIEHGGRLRRRVDPVVDRRRVRVGRAGNDGRRSQEGRRQRPQQDARSHGEHSVSQLHFLFPGSSFERPTGLSPRTGALFSVMRF